MTLIDRECDAVCRLFSRKAVRLQAPTPASNENPIFRRSRSARGQGSSFDLRNMREYQPCDDLRRIDWKLYGRTDRHYIKEFYEEENERFLLLVDTSASVPIFGTEYYLRFIASLAYIFLKLHLSVSLLAFSDRLGPSCLNLREQRSVPRMLGFLQTLRFAGPTDLVRALQAARERHRPTTLFLFSDLFDPGLGARHLRGFRRLFLAHCHTSYLSFPLPEGEVEIQDPESGRRLLLPNNPAVREQVRRTEQAFLQPFTRPRRGYHYLRLEKTMPRVPHYWRVLEALYD